MSEKISNSSISAALVKAQTEFNKALKKSTNPHFRSKFADLASCVDAVKESLNNNGIFLTQKPINCENGVKIETLFIHSSGEKMNMGAFFVPAGKKDAQGYGSALTYARRYSLMTACGIAPEDDDGNAATSAPQASQTNISPLVKRRQEIGKKLQGKFNGDMAKIKAWIADNGFESVSAAREDELNAIDERLAA